MQVSLSCPSGKRLVPCKKIAELNGICCYCRRRYKVASGSLGRTTISLANSGTDGDNDKRKKDGIPDLEERQQFECDSPS